MPVAFRPLAEAVLGELRRRGPLDLPELRPFRPALGRLVPEWLPREPAPGAESPVVLGEGLLRLLRILARHTMVTGAVYTQTLPFVAPETLQLSVDFERALYASRRHEHVRRG